MLVWHAASSAAASKSIGGLSRSTLRRNICITKATPPSPAIGWPQRCTRCSMPRHCAHCWTRRKKRRLACRRYIFRARRAHNDLGGARAAPDTVLTRCHGAPSAHAGRLRTHIWGWTASGAQRRLGHARRGWKHTQDLFVCALRLRHRFDRIFVCAFRRAARLAW